jgi:hypothetical protein
MAGAKGRLPGRVGAVFPLEWPLFWRPNPREALMRFARLTVPAILALALLAAPLAAEAQQAG